MKLLCRLVELPRATYYRWAKAAPSRRLLDDAYVANDIVDIYRQSRGTYGSPRVWGQLRRAGIRVGEKRVARIMAELALIGAHSRKKWRRGANSAPAGDLLERDFTAEASVLKWVADVAEFRCVDGKLYLAAKLLGGEDIEKSESDWVFHCTLCGACADVCQTEIPLVDVYHMLEKELTAIHGRPEEK